MGICAANPDICPSGTGACDRPAAVPAPDLTAADLPAAAAGTLTRLAALARCVNQPATEAAWPACRAPRASSKSSRI